MIKIEALSHSYQVREIQDEDVEAVVKLCRGNPLFYEHCPPFVTEDSVRVDLRELPPGKTLADKHYIGYFDHGRLAAVMDLIDGYPDDTTAFIGFFMTDAAIQHRGVGSRIIEELCAALGMSGFCAVRLCWVRGNPQSEGFWKKNGFRETGVTVNQDNYTQVVAERRL